MIKKVLLGLLALLILFLAGFVIYVQLSWDKKYDLAYPELKTSTDSAVIARGRYLAHGPAHCVTCHVGGYDELIQADRGDNVPLKGGVVFPLGPLGTLSPPNLTPDPETGIGRYEDGEIFRLMRHSVKPDGTATLVPMMPFANMADEDLVAIVSYLRSMEPVRNQTPEPNYSFIGKLVRVLAPTFKPVYEPDPWPKAPPMEPSVQRGEYLARSVANCVGCHTNRDPATFEAIGPEYAGGMEFEPLVELNERLGIATDLWVRSPNITPHAKSALSKFQDLDSWIARFRQGRVIMHSSMHWGPFSRMSEQDLEALWLYFNSLEPVEYEVGEIVFRKE